MNACHAWLEPVLVDEKVLLLLLVVDAILVSAVPS